MCTSATCARVWGCFPKTVCGWELPNAAAENRTWVIRKSNTCPETLNDLFSPGVKILYSVVIIRTHLRSWKSELNYFQKQHSQTT